MDGTSNVDDVIKRVDDILDLKNSRVRYDVAPCRLEKTPQVFDRQARVFKDKPFYKPAVGFEGVTAYRESVYTSSAQPTTYAFSPHSLLLGSGSFGDVVVGREKKARGEGLGGLVAVKIIRNPVNDDILDRALEEMRLARRVGPHPNVLRFFDCYLDAKTNRLYLVTELMIQGDLRSFVASKPGQVLSVSEVKRLVRGLIAGLKHMHDNGVVSILDEL